MLWPYRMMLSGLMPYLSAAGHVGHSSTPYSPLNAHTPLWPVLASQHWTPSKEGSCTFSLLPTPTPASRQTGQREALPQSCHLPPCPCSRSLTIRPVLPHSLGPHLGFPGVPHVQPLTARAQPAPSLQCLVRLRTARPHLHPHPVLGLIPQGAGSTPWVLVTTSVQASPALLPPGPDPDPRGPVWCTGPPTCMPSQGSPVPTCWQHGSQPPAGGPRLPLSGASHALSPTPRGPGTHFHHEVGHPASQGKVYLAHAE